MSKISQITCSHTNPSVQKKNFLWVIYLSTQSHIITHQDAHNSSMRDLTRAHQVLGNRIPNLLILSYTLVSDIKL